MIDLPKNIFVATQPVDMRLSFDRLAGIVRAAFERDPRGEGVFVFHNKRFTLLKLLWHDGSGYRILFKRLDRGRFRIPAAIPDDATHVRASARELRILLEGVDMARVRAARRATLEKGTRRRRTRNPTCATSENVTAHGRDDVHRMPSER